MAIRQRTRFRTGSGLPRKTFTASTIHFLPPRRRPRKAKTAHRPWATGHLRHHPGTRGQHSRGEPSGRRHYLHLGFPLISTRRRPFLNWQPVSEVHDNPAAEYAGTPRNRKARAESSSSTKRSRNSGIARNAPATRGYTVAWQGTDVKGWRIWRTYL